MLSDMTDGATHLRQIVQRRVEAEGLHPLARRTGLGIGQIRSICTGRAPLLTTVIQVCAALGYELVIRPRGAAAPEAPTPVKSPEFDVGNDTPAPPDRTVPTPASAPGVAFEPVPDRRIAEVLAVLADEWEAADARTREALLIRFWHAYPDLRERAAARAGRRLARLARGGGRA